MIKIKSGICIFCGLNNARDYSIHGRGKGQKINYFHKDCYIKSIRKEEDEKK